jgi:2-polyprenyl-3-methyl-5-hydroxy-6-metoxy-1,4-benzoquinol methylase
VVDYSRRLAARELMDEPETADEELRGALRELESINRRLGGHASSLAGIRKLLPAGRGGFSVLDVGCGAGDLSRAVAAWARPRRLRAEVLGIDRSRAAVDYARERARGIQGLAFETQDLFALEGEGRFDVVHAGLVLHHFDGEDAFRALEAMFRLARLGVVVNDLHRHPLAFHAIRALSRLVWRHRLIRNDGPISVLRGFRRVELEDYLRRLGGPSAEIRWRWAFRWSVVIRKGAAP